MRVGLLFDAIFLNPQAFYNYKGTVKGFSSFCPPDMKIQAIRYFFKKNYYKQCKNEN